MSEQTSTNGTNGGSPLAAAPPQVAALQALEADLRSTLLERDEAVRAALVAVLARQHVVLLGPPGTGKSMLVTELATRIGGGLSTFTLLLTRFTTPEELFGPISVAGLKKDEYRRLTTNKLPEAHLAFLDEIFKANSAVLNALLTLLNERQFDNGPTRLTCPLLTCFGASNEMPQGDDLGALWDRFALRLIVDYVGDSAFGKLLRLNGASASTPVTLSNADLEALQGAAARLPVPDTVVEALITLRRELGGKGVSASDRRWRQSLALLRANALLEGRKTVEEDDLGILSHSLWTTPDQRQEIARTVARMANPLNAKALELLDQAASVHDQVMHAQANGSDDEQKMHAAVEGNTKLKKITTHLKKLAEQAESEGRSGTKIAQATERVTAMRQDVTGLVLN